MIFHSIRWRLQTWHSLILLAVLSGFGFTAFQVARDNQWRRIDQELEQHLAFALMPAPRRHPPGFRGPGFSREGPPGERRPGFRGNPEMFREMAIQSIERAISIEAVQTNGFYYALWSRDGTLLTNSPSAPAGLTRPAEAEEAARPKPPPPQEDAGARPRPAPAFSMATTLRTRGLLREAYKCMPSGDCLLVGRSIAPDLAAMRRLAFWLAGAGAGVLVVGLAGGWWVATRAIRPIESISRAALKISAGDLSQRIDTADTDSELGRLATVLNATFARLEAAFAHQSRFTSDASHELRTPVSVILSQTQTALSRERPNEEYCQALQACRRAAERMRNLIQSLLELARLDAGEASFKRQTVDLGRVARESLDLVRPLAEERGVEIRTDLAAAECCGDPERMGQVVTNLLTNAIHFNRERGEVRVSTKAEDSTALLIVADTGQGIPPEDLPHIFERFYRVDKSRSRIQGRTGLGLAISKAIVDAHSGRIEVSSQPGVGSTFTVKLPLK